MKHDLFVLMGFLIFDGALYCASPLLATAVLGLGIMFVGIVGAKGKKWRSG